MKYENPKVYGDTSITDGLVFTDHEDPIFRVLHRQVVPICRRSAPSSRNFTLVGNEPTGGTFERTKSSLLFFSCFLAGVRPLLKVECQIGCQMGVKYGHTPFFFETVHILCVCFLICQNPVCE